MDEYIIRVSGRLSDALLSAFPSLRGQPLPVQTVMRGELPDQAALQGVLNRLDELGVEIVSVDKLPPDGAEPAGQSDSAEQVEPSRQVEPGQAGARSTRRHLSIHRD